MRLIALLALALAWAAPGAAVAKARDTLIVGLQLEPPTLDPTAGAAAAIDEVTYRTIFEGLTTLDPSGAPVPLLATGWTMAADARSYVFHLRSGVRFQDGTPFDARIAAFSLLRAIRPGSANAQAQALAEIAAIEIVDPLTVRIRLKTPDTGLPTLLAWGDCVMVSPRSAATLATAPIGTGPFVLSNWRRGDRLRLVRNVGYWGARPALSTIEFRFVADPAAAFAAMRTHAIDVFPDYPVPEQLAQLRADPSLKVTTAPSQGEVIVALNNARGPMRDRRVRQAISYAIDRRAIIDGAMYGYGTPIGSHFPPQSPDYLDLTGLYPHDPAKARTLLAAAGYANGFDAVLKLPPPAYARRSGEIVAAQLRAVGIRLTIVPVEWTQWLDEVFTRHAYDMTIVNHAEPADYVIYGRRDYYFNYDGAAVRALLGRLKQAPQAERHQLLQAIQRRIAEDAVNAFLFQFPHLSVADARLADLWANTPLQAIDFGRARFVGGADPAETADERPGSGWRIAGSAALLGGLIALTFAAGPFWMLRRIGILLVTLVGASLIIFALMQAAPGDPAQFMMGLEASPAAVSAVRAELGLDGSLPTRFVAWATGMLSGDLGTSYAYRVPVAGLIAPRLAVSLPLAGLALLLAVLIGLPMALIGAARPGAMRDRLLAILSRIGLSIPAFWLAMLLLLLFAVRLQWIVGSGFVGWESGPTAALGSLIVPGLALAIPQAAVIARVARGAIGDELARDYVRTARAKGLGRHAILWRHILPNAAPPILAVIGLQFPFLLAGSVVVENIFALPGLGQLVLQAIGGRDLIVVQAVAMLMVLATVCASFLVDAAQALLDPRLRHR